jgi:hypothetical protein
MDVYVDESKSRGYLLVAASVYGDHLRATRKEVRNLILPGQRSLHMKDERDSRKREIADMISGMGTLGMRVVIYDAGRSGTERNRRARCLEALVEHALEYKKARIVFDRRTRTDPLRAASPARGTNACYPGRDRVVLEQRRGLAPSDQTNRE